MTCAPPTVPNLIELPSTVPWTVVVPPVERSIVPFSFDDASVQFSVNVPEYAPPYVPFHFPESALSDDELDAGGGDDAGVEAGVLAGVEAARVAVCCVVDDD